MTRDESVVVTLIRLRETGKTAVLAKRTEAVASAGYDFVDIALMADVEDHPVARGIIHAMQRDGKLNGAEIRREMPARAGYAAYHIIPQLLTQRLERFLRQLFYII